MRMDDVVRGLLLPEMGRTEPEITGVEYDSRRVGPGSVFVAMRGEATDGNRYIAQAVERGTAAVVTDSPDVYASAGERWPGVPFAFAEHGRRALAEVSGDFFGHPERQMAVCAVTGTNGKTTTAWLLEQMLRSVHRKCVLVGTIETHVGDEVRVSEHTTPESRDLYALFADGVRVGAAEAVMEMSSHALEQERVWGMPVDVAIFTNLTQDHLDYHGTMENYFVAKAKLFAGVGTAPPRVSVVNAMDPYGERLLDQKLSGAVSYGMGTGDWRAERVRYGAGWTQFFMQAPSGGIEVQSPLSGPVNVMNLLAAACAGYARGLTLEEIAAATGNLRQVPGRFETVPNELGITVVVDYAHTEDALRNLTGLARELVGAGRVITLFGCGGDRDRTKRPKMGRAAGAGSDLVVLTSDNPRSEDPKAILAEVLVGLRETGVKYLVQPDRAKAIGVAIGSAGEGDIVLLAGKGHEKVQELRHGTIPFDDVSVAAGVLRGLEVF